MLIIISVKVMFVYWIGAALGFQNCNISGYVRKKMLH